MEELTPLYIDALFRPLHGELLSCLKNLTPSDWERATLAKAWSVKDVAAHLLDGDLRTLSVLRDGYQIEPDAPIKNYADLVSYLNGLNHQWVAASNRLSPRLLIELLEMTGEQVADIFESLPKHGKAIYAVDWAGEEHSENWMHTGREYTERWHHQMQIREASGMPPLFDHKWYFPLLDFSMRALPLSYSRKASAEGTKVCIEVADVGTWSLSKAKEKWLLFRGPAANPTTTITLSCDAAWKVFYNAFKSEAFEDVCRVEGELELVAPFWSSRSVMV